ncbi:MAG TPA: reverse transcriptase-like protein [Vicinamibacterales bacterium]|jgi:probable phosphoglycerate mutase|nr:reverse transcriptase-like protein [Vicinamibacterales bacterium]
MNGVVAYIDGGARGNPGPAGFGVRVESADGTLIEEFSDSIGTATNNVAEYRGLLAALGWARQHGHRALHVRSDSLLLVQQMLGNFKVKNEGLKPLHAKARLLAHEIGKVTFEHVRRESNAHADRLANSAMDGAAETPEAKAAPAKPAAPAASSSFRDVALAIRDAIDRAVPALRAMRDEGVGRPADADGWSRKEIVGHLIDSAANNHQRFVRAQEKSPLVFPEYDQAAWVSSQDYNHREWTDLLDLWAAYNRHLAHVLDHMPASTQSVECRIGTKVPATLGWLAEDYLAHLRHHVAQLR